MITVQIEASGLAGLASRLKAAANPRAMLLVVGREGANQLRSHFRKRDQGEANKLGGRRQHFWLGVMRSVQAPVMETDREVAIAIDHPAYAQKLFGGTITAKRAKNLTIPQTPEAYGRSAATFEHETGTKLFFVSTRGGGVLARKIAGANESQRGGLQVEYLLKPSVTQAADANALPQQETLEAALVARADAVLDRQINPEKPDKKDDEEEDQTDE